MTDETRGWCKIKSGAYYKHIGQRQYNLYKRALWVVMSRGEKVGAYTYWADAKRAAHRHADGM